MGKKSRDRHRAQRAATESLAGSEAASEGAVGPRQPCPCGSGRRYKACHGSLDGAPVFNARPFAGLASETDLIALREFVPAATAPLTLRDSDRDVVLCSLLPGAAAALVREDGTVWLGLQVQHSYGDPSRDLACVLLTALAAEPGSMVGLAEDPGDGPRLQDLLADTPPEVSVHQGFDYWLADVEDIDGSIAEVLEQANDAVAPTERVAGVDAAYWTRMGAKEYLRWVLPHDEDAVLDAFARLHVAGEDVLVPGSRMIGMFRAHGLAVPVWGLPPGTGAVELAAPAARMAEAIASALASPPPLSTDERAARSGLANRQLTIR